MGFRIGEELVEVIELELGEAQVGGSEGRVHAVWISEMVGRESVRASSAMKRRARMRFSFCSAGVNSDGYQKQIPDPTGTGA